MFISPHIPLEFNAETPGRREDLQLFVDDRWLMNTEVRYLLQKRKGLWELTMLYISVLDPLKFICRKIDTYSSEKKAKTFAQILQRGIRKDARGTLKTNRDAFNFCDN